MRVDVLGVGFDNYSMAEAKEAALRLMKEEKTAYTVTPNPEIVWEARKNSELKAALDSADLVIPDGIGVVYGAAILKTPLKERVPGIELATLLIEEMSAVGGRVYLLGSKPGVAEKAAEELKKRFPGLVICGTGDGYFKDDGPVIEKINAQRPDLLLVCLGFPKQEIWMHRCRERIKAGMMMGLGGVLDVFAGDVKRAPDAWCNLGLEWLYRLLKQPSRIKRMIKLPVFLLAVIGERLKK
ncbi:MAG: WecB/TagA/CpsF family glycosyltransferase [Oscillospiraceae bacterium]|jgi:N-acetylglucosaminyldiphosphoundecaprenol N-acetyl-beta-D-mannosaminyltransferase|nr:WecB/TagA/CpsF family glycosyltransferase [Oscillospiraceae bacterium]